MAPNRQRALQRRGGIGGFGLPALAGGGGVIGLIVLARRRAARRRGRGQRGAGRVRRGPRRGADRPATEDEQFVEFLAEDTQAVWADIFAEEGRQYSYATVNTFTGQVQTGCGGATSAVGPFYCPADEKVYIDLDFFDELATRFGAPGDFAQAYVIAHEVGHHVQNLLGTSDAVRERAGRELAEEANQWSVRLELQADCFAGVWAHQRGSRTQRRRRSSEGDIEEGLAAAAAVGDDRIQAQAGMDVEPRVWTHGSSEQRQRVVQPRLRVGRLDHAATPSAMTATGDGRQAYALTTIPSSEPWAEAGQAQRAWSASISLGRTLWTSPTMPRSAIEKIGASASLLMAMMFFEPFMPTMCWVAPEMPAAM